MEPKLTMQMTMHLNGGSEFSRLVFDVLADGNPTGIVRRKTTTGSPKYLITEDVFFCGDEQFDNLAARGVGCKEWILAHLPTPTAGAEATPGSP